MNKHNNAWSVNVKYPDTLYLLNEYLKDEGDTSPRRVFERFRDFYWGPDDLQENDIVIFVVEHGNLQKIKKLINELIDNPNEWDKKTYSKMFEDLNKAEREYLELDGKVVCACIVDEVQYCYDADENGKLIGKYASFIYKCKIIESSKSEQFDEGLLKYSYSETIDELTNEQLNKLTNSFTSKQEGINDFITSKNDPKYEYSNNVQGFVVNNAFEKTLFEILDHVESSGSILIDALIGCSWNEWTVPRWCKQGDIAFFMFSKTSIDTIRGLAIEFQETKSKYSQREQRIIKEALEYGESIYEKLGGCIFAFGRVSSKTRYIKQTVDTSHWRSPFYAIIEDIVYLDNPISISEFRSFLTIQRQTAITPVLGVSFDKLREYIIDTNHVLDYFLNVSATPMPLSELEETNWLDFGMEYRRHFFLEDAFRRYYVDYLLSELGDTKKFYRECGCYKALGNPPRVDNVIKFYGKYLPVEVKLSITNEKDINGQCKQYCELNKISLNKEKNIITNDSNTYMNNVLIIDTFSIYLYSHKTNEIAEIKKLDNIRMLSDIEDLKETIANMLDD